VAHWQSRAMSGKLLRSGRETRNQDGARTAPIANRHIPVQSREIDVSNPDWIYDPDDWEYTMPWPDRSTLTEDTIKPRLGEIKRFCTLINGPEKFAAYVLKKDAQDEGDVELQWFDSEAAAREACGMPAHITQG
jgi:hypothetical protein